MAKLGELLGHTGKLKEARNEDDMAPSYPDHGGLELRRGRAHGGDGGSGQCALTKTQSAQLRGGGGRGGHGRAMVELAVVFLRWRAS